MKTVSNLGLLAVLAFGSLPAFAQFDDVYFDPSETPRVTYSDRNSSSDNADNAVASDDYDSEYYDPTAYGTPRSGDDGRQFDNQPFTYDDYSGFEYSSRIRRFNRPYAGFDYFDPVYVDQLYYGGALGASTMLIYNSPYNFAAYQSRFANPWSPWYNPFWGPAVAVGPRGGFNRWNDPFYDPFWGGAGNFAWGAPRGAWGPGFGAGFGPGFGGGFAGGGFAGGGGGYYCPPSWGGGIVYNTPNPVPVNTSVRPNVSDRAGNRASGTRGAATRTPSTTTQRPDGTGSSRTYRDINNTSTRPAPTRNSTRNGGEVAPRSSAPRSNTRPSSATRPSATPRTESARPSAPSRPTPSSSSSRPSPQRSSARPSPSYERPRSSPSSRPTYSAPSRSSSPSGVGRSSSPSGSSRTGRPN